MKQKLLLVLAVLISLSIGWSNESFAQEGKKRKARPAKLDVKKLKKRYWSEKEDYDVVQNRAFSKKGRLELHVFGGFTLSDPFLRVYQVGASLNYHFTEYLGFSANYWKYFAGLTSTADVYQERVGVAPVTNQEQAYYGGEFNWNFVYGKRNILGKSILYYDMHLLAGLGLTQTQNGSFLTPNFGIGQQTYFTKSFAFRTDYRIMIYTDQISGADRTNFNHVITLGFSLFLF